MSRAITFYGVNRENFIIIIIIININQIINILSSRNAYLHAPPTSNRLDVSTVFAKLSVCNCWITDSHQISYSQLQRPAGYRRHEDEGTNTAQRRHAAVLH